LRNAIVSLADSHGGTRRSVPISGSKFGTTGDVPVPAAYIP